MRIEEVIPSDEEAFGVPNKEDIEEHYGNNHRGHQVPHRPVKEPLEDEVEEQSEQSGDAVVDRPDGEQKVAWLSVVGVATARASIEWGEPIMRAPGAGQGGKDGVLPADRATEKSGADKIGPRFAPGGALNHFLFPYSSGRRKSKLPLTWYFGSGW